MGLIKLIFSDFSSWLRNFWLDWFHILKSGYNYMMLKNILSIQIIIALITRWSSQYRPWSWSAGSSCTRPWILPQWCFCQVLVWIWSCTIRSWVRTQLCTSCSKYVRNLKDGCSLGLFLRSSCTRKCSEGFWETATNQTGLSWSGIVFSQSFDSHTFSST